jgi:hypothetical protein
MKISDVCRYMDIQLIAGRECIFWGIRKLPSPSNMFPHLASSPLGMGGQSFLTELQPPSCFGVETMEKG